MSITLTYLHDIPVDSLSVKLFDGSELVATVDMSAVTDVDRDCLWTGTLSEEPASHELEWEAFENGGTQKAAWGDATGFVDGATVRLDEDRSITSLDGVATSGALSVVDSVVDAIKAQTDKLYFGVTGSTLKAEATNLSDIATTSNVATAVYAVLEGIAGLHNFNPSTQTVTVGTNNDKTGYALSTAPPTKEAIASQVRTELKTEMDRIDATVSSRSNLTSEALPENFEKLTIGEGGTLAVTAELPDDFPEFPENFGRLLISEDGTLSVEAEAVVGDEEVERIVSEIRESGIDLSKTAIAELAGTIVRFTPPAWCGKAFDRAIVCGSSYKGDLALPVSVKNWPAELISEATTIRFTGVQKREDGERKFDFEVDPELVDESSGVTTLKVELTSTQTSSISTGRYQCDITATWANGDVHQLIPDGFIQEFRSPNE